MQQKIVSYVITHLPERMKSGSKTCFTVWVIFTTWFAYCYSSGTLYTWNYTMSPLYLEDFKLLHVIVMHNQVLWGLIADIHPAFNLLLICILSMVLNYLARNDLYEPMFVRDLIIHMNIALIIPTSSKIYAHNFSYKQLCLMFCFIKCSLTFVNFLAKNGNNYMETLYGVFMLCMTVTTILSIKLPILYENEFKKEFPSTNIGSKILWLVQKPLVINVALCTFLQKFLGITTMEYIESNISSDINEAQFQTDMAASILCGLVATGLNFTRQKHFALKYLYRIQLLTSPFIYIATYLIQHINLQFVVFIYSLYFTMMEVFLTLPLSVSVGEYFSYSGAAVTAIAMATGTTGEAAAYFVLRLLPPFVNPVIAMIIMVLYTYAIYFLNEYYEESVLLF